VGTGGGKFSYLGKLDHYEGNGKNTLLIVLDTPDKKRIDCGEIDSFEYKIKIDHHPFVEEFCNIELINDQSSSTCELIMKMLYKTKLKQSKEIMEKLFLGLVSDTNRFMFNNSTSSTFKIVSQVMNDYNLDISKLYADLYMRPLNEIRLQGYMGQNMKVTENGVGYIKITEDILKRFEADVASGGNMINNFNYIEEVLVWLAITEDVKNDLIKINIRSRGPVINTIAEKYNGGGHKLASGAKVMTMDEVECLIKDLDDACKKYIESLDNEVVK
jgi:phosphoesterase RecJ-like protein